MKEKYSTTQVQLTNATTTAKKDIHQQLEETIAERKKIIQRVTEAARVINAYLGNTKAA